jgi:tetratricopeptide (TPR) repeat protein
VGHIRRLMQAGDWRAALDAIDQALNIEPLNVIFLMHRAKCLLALDRRHEALIVADAIEHCMPADPTIWDAVGMVRTSSNDHRGALAAYDHAVAIAPQEAHFVYNRACARRILGDLEGAEADYDRVISLRPLDYEAYVNRSELRVQTEVRNHVNEMEALLADNIENWRGEVQIRFALAKEYEDLGEFAKSFEQVRRGARMRRAHMNYEVAIDTETVDWIIKAFPFISTETVAATEGDAPIFIVGLPRSGTTLVERILSSHSLVSSAGELDCFASALVDAVHQKSGQAHVTRQQFVTLSATLDFAALGRDYMRRALNVFTGTGRFIDKMPLNYLYCGLIHRALPHAKIIHVTRNPMAVGYAMYKTLFKSGYPFSYDLGEIAQYYVAYRRLMKHWDTVMPGATYQVSYEDLVENQLVETHKLLEYCDLQWQDACVAFHRNPAPSTTASASQVRRPLYRSSVSQWRHYEHELSKLRDMITAAGYGV